MPVPPPGGNKALQTIRTAVLYISIDLCMCGPKYNLYHSIHQGLLHAEQCVSVLAVAVFDYMDSMYVVD